MPSVEIPNFPMPPTANGLYAWNGRRMVKTKAYTDYDKAVMHWLVMNQDCVRLVRDYVKEIEKQVLHIETTFHMSKSSILCKDGRPKKNDTSNRIKALHDVLASVILGIDDSYFWSGTFSKTIAEFDPFVFINISLRKIEETPWETRNQML
jgi:Holliday junction resolvase RusA-like endonuclease